ncbi:hypothetical protein [Bacillus mycoides]|uniref:hypothetical protein n=1 Tax=Bacillus mycoides TaxID=1405 RepID=UPI0021116C3E|nr:hypothetical protein [Bacillus mycoides]MCQ6530927.1 hypothetical protein [Bacillus mycoides]
MVNKKFMFASIIRFFTMATISAKKNLNTPLLNKIYAITLNKMILVQITDTF